MDEQVIAWKVEEDQRKLAWKEIQLWVAYKGPIVSGWEGEEPTPGAGILRDLGILE